MVNAVEQLGNRSALVLPSVAKLLKFGGVNSKFGGNMDLVGRFFDPPKASFFLFGPRGTGKSTFLRQVFPDALWLDLLDPALLRQVLARPEHLRQLVEGAPQLNTVVIDEIQKAPGLLDVIHALIEQRPGLRFVLTGSSARKLKRTGADLMAGRALLHSLHPFMAAELGPAFSLERALRDGLLPLVWSAPDAAATLRAYAALYIQEEVMAESLVRNVGDFSRFVEVISFSHGSVMNISNVARECAVGRKAVEAYVQIVEDLLLAFRLPVFTRRSRRQLTRQPKFYYCDTGVFRSLRPAGPLDRPAEIDGAALEGLVAQHLRAWTAYTPGRNDLYFWRTSAGREVDFVLYGDVGLHAFEVKHAARVSRADLSGLRAFADEYPQARLTLLYRGAETLNVDGIICRPVEAFLAALSPGSLPG